MMKKISPKEERAELIERGLAKWERQHGAPASRRLRDYRDFFAGIHQTWIVERILERLSFNEYAPKLHHLQQVADELMADIPQAKGKEPAPQTKEEKQFAQWFLHNCAQCLGRGFDYYEEAMRRMAEDCNHCGRPSIGAAIIRNLEEYKKKREQKAKDQERTRTVRLPHGYVSLPEAQILMSQRGNHD